MGTMKQQSITTLPASPDEERRRRMIRYAVTMGIRMVCIVLMLFVQGWWLLVCALGAILLPYFAVVAANVHGEQRAPTVLRPGAVATLPRPDIPPAAPPTAGPPPTEGDAR
jgi:predicted cobalt transporter CbtA